MNLCTVDRPLCMSTFMYGKYDKCLHSAVGHSELLFFCKPPLFFTFPSAPSSTSCLLVLQYLFHSPTVFSLPLHPSPSLPHPLSFTAPPPNGAAGKDATGVLALVYFAGHGFMTPHDFFEYLMPVDAVEVDLASNINRANFCISLRSESKFAKLLRITDCCRTL